jgi:hypothetical protein
MLSRSGWFPTNSFDFNASEAQQSIQPPRLADPSFEMDSSSIGAYSVPSFIGKSNRIDFQNHLSESSEVLDADTVRSANYAISATPPTKSRSYHKKPRRPLIHPLDAALASRKLPHRDLDLKKVLLETKRQSSLVLAATEPHHSSFSNQLPDISVAGKKFAAPLLLPRL